MSGNRRICPRCGGEIDTYRNPFPTVDLILMDPEETGVWLVERRNPPPGWALPGGFVEVGEGLEAAAAREGREETSLEIEILDQFRAYGDPGRDPRFHTITVVFLAHGRGAAVARDDARSVRFFPWDAIPAELAFDHKAILGDYRRTRRTGAASE